MSSRVIQEISNYLGKKILLADLLKALASTLRRVHTRHGVNNVFSNHFGISGRFKGLDYVTFSPVSICGFVGLSAR